VVTLPELVAHRGYPRRYPENTLPGVAAALRLGARFVEVDVQLSADRVPFLHHDRTLERVCGTGGAVHERPAAALEALRAAEAGVHGTRFQDVAPARLEEVVQLVARHPGVGLFVDLKTVGIERFGPSSLVDAVLPALRALGGRAALIATDPETLREVRRRGGHPTGLILRSFDQMDDGSAVALAPDYVFCRIERLPPSGRIDRPWTAMAVYDSVDPEQALSLAGRGAAYVETFAIGEMLRALRGGPA